MKDDSQHIFPVLCGAFAQHFSQSYLEVEKREPMDLRAREVRFELRIELRGVGFSLEFLDALRGDLRLRGVRLPGVSG